MILQRLILRHCREQDEGYLEHARFAGAVGSRMVLGGLACLVHAALPCAFTTTGSRTVRELSARLAARSRASADERGAGKLRLTEGAGLTERVVSSAGERPT